VGSFGKLCVVACARSTLSTGRRAGETAAELHDKIFEFTEFITAHIKIESDSSSFPHRIVTMLLSW